MKGKDIKKDIYSTFAETASNIGYSEIHGRLIAALLVEGRPMSMQELSKEIGYSVSTISISLDLLELLGMIKKIKKVGDRNLYVKLKGDLLGGLKKAFLLKIQKSVDDSLFKFREYERSAGKLNATDKKKVLKTLKVLEKEIKRLDKYVKLISKMKMPFSGLR